MVTVRMSRSFRDQLRREARARGQSLQVFCERALRDALDTAGENRDDDSK
jgi:predicted HicB family RNase H-like nuclease